jgi:hypothetical protein
LGSICQVTVPANPVTVINGSCNASLVLTLALQGYYNTGGTLTPVLYNQGVSASTTITDQILVQLVDPVTYYFRTKQESKKQELMCASQMKQESRFAKMQIPGLRCAAEEQRIAC